MDNYRLDVVDGEIEFQHEQGAVLRLNAPAAVKLSGELLHRAQQIDPRFISFGAVNDALGYIGKAYDLMSGTDRAMVLDWCRQMLQRAAR